MLGVELFVRSVSSLFVLKAPIVEVRIYKNYIMQVPFFLKSYIVLPFHVIHKGNKGNHKGKGNYY